MAVTRFAPSPTGYLHVGGARTALFSWLYARHTGGKFILRIEDTDTKRNTPTAMQQVMDDLRWLGIDWDEGPEVDGPGGPYLQSQRRDIYDKYMKQLIDEGKAYYCFDTPAEIQAIRDKAAAEKRNFVYPRPAFFPDVEDVQQARDEGRPVTIRFAVQAEKPIVIEDIVRGTVEFAAGEIGDFIIQKSDGFPTYHFACVVDDELMGVTHIIRGQEHLMNTPGHQVLQDALGFGRPAYAHMSVTVSETGGKLSKRQRPKSLQAAIKSMQEPDIGAIAEAGGLSLDEFDSFLKGKSVPDMPSIDAIAEFLGVHLPEINIVDFFKGGYLPETMVNFLALLGWNPGDDREIMERDELVECFDIERFSKTNSLFDRKKLMSFNTEHIRLTAGKTLLASFKNYLKAIDSPVAAADDEMLGKFLEINPGARTLEQIEQKCRFLFFDNDKIDYDEKAVKKVLLKGDGQGLEVLGVLRDKLEALEDFTEEGIETMLRSLAEERGVGLGKIAQPLRVAICGNIISPPIFDSVQLLGIDNTLARIDITKAKFQQ
jgi:glutamyl-tRNA synthetase